MRSDHILIQNHALIGYYVYYLNVYLRMCNFLNIWLVFNQAYICNSFVFVCGQREKVPV